MHKTQPQKVAIVGSGLAGLVSASLLSHDPGRRYTVTVLESVQAHCLFARTARVHDVAQS